MTTVGLWMLLALGALITTTGLPIWALLVGTSSAFAVAGLLMGVVDINVLAALSPRIVGLLENDLLQALPLYVFIGVLLQRVTVADAIFSSLVKIFRPFGAASSIAALATLTVGSLIAPMSGSVGSTASLLSRLVAHRLRNLAPARAVALVSAAATIGVVVPPSLVLILLGDAMLRAHLEASNLPGFSLGSTRIISTQDLFNAALLPAAVALLLWLFIAWRQVRSAESEQAPEDEIRLTRTQMVTAFTAIAVIVLLLAGVFTGKLFAVEAAATGGCLLMVAALASRALSWPAWREVLHDTLTLSGALFALLVGATTFSLVFRAFGSDRWLSELVLNSTYSPQLTALCVLLFVALCAWVLDAFEMIFVVIPIVGPALIAKLGDAQQAAVLLLLVLQTSFLIPPMGYAVLMVRSRGGLAAASTPQIVKSLLPFILVQFAMTVGVFALPQIVHLLDPPKAAASGEPAKSEEDIINQMKAMSGVPTTESASDAKVLPPPQK